MIDDELDEWPAHDSYVVEGDLTDPTTATAKACELCGARPAWLATLWVGCIPGPGIRCRRCIIERPNTVVSL